MRNQEGNFELTTRMFVGYATLALGNNLATTLWICIGGFVKICT